MGEEYSMKLAVEASALALPGTGIREFIVNTLAAAMEAQPQLEVILSFTGARRDAAVAAEALPGATLSSFVLPEALAPHRDKIAFLAGGVMAPQADAYWGPNGFLPLFLGARRRVLTVHDLTYLLFPGFYPARSSLFRSKLASSLTRAHAIIAVSCSTRADLCRLFSVPEERVLVLYEIVHPSLFREVPAGEIARVRETLGIAGEYLLTVGTLQPRKNFAGLIRAFSLLDDDLTLVIAGSKGWLCDDIFQARDASPRRERIVITGAIGEEERPALYRGARGFVFPSFYEGFGIPLLEAFAAGVPVAASNASSLPEVAGDGALLFDPRSDEAMAGAMRTIAQDDGVRKELVRSGRERLKEFDRTKIAAEFLTILGG